MQRQDLLSCLAWGECWSTQGKMLHYLHTPHWTAERLPGGRQSPLPSSHPRPLFSYKPVRLPSSPRERKSYSAHPCKGIFIWKSEMFSAGDCIHLQWNGSMIWQDFSIFNCFDWQSSNLTKLDFLLIILYSTKCYLGSPTWGVKPHLHGEGIYDDEIEVTLEVVRSEGKVPLMMTMGRDTLILCQRLHNKNPSFYIPIFY